MLKDVVGGESGARKVFWMKRTIFKNWEKVVYEAETSRYSCGVVGRID